MAQLLAPGLNVSSARQALRRAYVTAPTHTERLAFLRHLLDFEDDIARMRLPMKARR